MGDAEILREIADGLARRTSRHEMAGDFLRELAVLLTVFVPLEAMFNPGRLRGWQVAAIVVAALALGYAGMRLEETRR